MPLTSVRHEPYRAGDLRGKFQAHYPYVFAKFRCVAD